MARSHATTTPPTFAYSKQCGEIVLQGGEGTRGNPPSQYIGMANNQGQKPNLDRYVVIHVATTCDEHGVYVTKDSAEVIELGWILLDAKSCDEVHFTSHSLSPDLLK